VSAIAEDFSVSVHTDGEIAVVEVAGEVDMRVAPELEEALAPKSLGGCRSVVVDLTGVSFMDSTGVRALLVAHSAYQEAGIGSAVAVGADSPAHRVIELVEVADMLSVHSDRAAAEASLAEGGG
jgi:anti-anti-sigma factor